MRIALALTTLVYLASWIVRSEIQRRSLSGRLPLDTFAFAVGAILTAPYLSVLAASFWARPGVIAACAGCSIGLAIANSGITLFLLPRRLTPEIMVGAAEAGLLLVSLWVAGQLGKTRTVVSWALLSPVLLLLWYAAVFLLFVSRLKPWH